MNCNRWCGLSTNLPVVSVDTVGSEESEGSTPADAVPAVAVEEAAANAPSLDVADARGV